MQEQIHTLDDGSAGRQIHPFGFHRLMKFPRRLINGGRSSFTRVRRPFKVETNSGTLFPKQQSRLTSSRDPWTRDLIASLSVRLAKASSSWIASFSQFLGSPRNVVLDCGVRAATVNSAQRAACLRHSLGPPGIGWLPAVAGRKRDRSLGHRRLSRTKPIP